MWFRKEKPTPQQLVRDLREKALTVEPSEIRIAPSPGHERAWGLLMETGYAEAVATLVCLADGTTSLYFSNGGGIIGAGEHASVRDAAERFIAKAHSHLVDLAPSKDHAMPAVGRVRFHVRTFDGTRTADADEQDLGYGRHALSPLFHAGHEVITAIRESGAM